MLVHNKLIEPLFLSVSYFAVLICFTQCQHILEKEILDFAEAPEMYPPQPAESECTVTSYFGMTCLERTFFYFYVLCCSGAAEVPPRLPVQSSHGEVPLQSLAS
jgi:hypothetical protein